MLNQDSVDFKLAGLMGGIKRFYSEGYNSWKKKDLLAELNVDSEDILTHPRVEQAFIDWQQQGFIEVVGRDDCYFKVLKPFPHGYKYL